MNCQQAVELIEDAIDRRLSGSVKRRLDLHLARCARCRARFIAEQREHARWYRALNEGAHAQATLPEGFSERLEKAVAAQKVRRTFFGQLPRWVRIAAALVVMASLSALGAWTIKTIGSLGAIEDGRAENAVDAPVVMVASEREGDRNDVRTLAIVTASNDVSISKNAEALGTDAEGRKSSMNLRNRVAAYSAVMATAATSLVSGSAGNLPLDANGVWQEEVLYVETDGSKSYFDSGVVVGPDTRVVACVAFVSWPSYGTAVGAGGTPNVATMAFAPSGSDNGDVWRTNVSGNWDDPGWQKSTLKADKNFHVWDLKSGAQRIDGLPISDKMIAADAPAMCKFILGARQVAFRGSTTPEINSFTKMRIRSCRIYSGAEIVRDYVAACRDGSYGLLDRIDGSFHVATGGSFTGKRRKAAIPVEYVESKKSKLHVNTGILPTERTRVVADVAFQLTDGTLMGSGGNGAASILFGTSWDNTFQWYVGNAYQTTVPGGVEDKNRHVWDLSSGSQKIDGTQYATATIPAGSIPGPSFILFARRLVTKDAVDSWHPAKMWGCKMYDGDVLLRDFQPCWWNDRYCLEDRVTGNFFHAVGEAIDSDYGANDLGGSALDLPYKKHSQLTTTGDQYVDTRVKPTDNMHVWAEMAFEEVRTDQYQLMGWAADQNHLTVLLGSTLHSSFGGWLGLSYTAPQDYEKGADTAFHIWEFAKGSQKIDGIELSTQTVASGKSDFEDNRTFYLFARNRSWSMGNPDWFAKVKMRGFKIWKGDKLVRDYVPADVGGRACLYDRVNNLPYFSPVGDEFRVKDEGMLLILK